MNDAAEARRVLLAYLLGELPEEERRAIDERVLSDQDFSDELREAQFDLIEDYHAGRLSSQERRRADAAFSAERLRQEPSLARASALSSALQPRVAGKVPHPWLRWSVAAGMLVLCVVGGWFLVSHFALERRSLTARDSVSPADAGKPVAAPASGGTTAVVLLAADAMRGAGSPTLELRPSTRSILVQWVVPAGTGAERFSLSVGEGHGILATVRQDGDRQSIDGHEVVSFRLDRSSLAAATPGSQLLMLIRSTDPSRPSEAEFTVSLSRP